MKLPQTHFEFLCNYVGITKPAVDVTTEELTTIYAKAVELLRHKMDDQMYMVARAEMLAIMGFLAGGKKTYRIGKEFGQTLKYVGTDINIKYLMPETFSAYYINFATTNCAMFTTDNPSDFEGCYVTINPESDLVNLGFVGKVGNVWRPVMDFLTLNVKDCSTISEAVTKCENAPSAFSKLSEEGRKLVTFVANCIVYIRSGDPDLREFKKPRPKGIKNFSQWFKKTQYESCLSSILVGFNYKKPTVTYGEFAVRGHWRWQPCGPMRSMVKLIWIDDFVKGSK